MPAQRLRICDEDIKREKRAKALAPAAEPRKAEAEKTS